MATTALPPASLATTTLASAALASTALSSVPIRLPSTAVGGGSDSHEERCDETTSEPSELSVLMLSMPIEW